MSLLTFLHPGDFLHRAEIMAPALRERPLLCLTAGLLAGSILGMTTPFWLLSAMLLGAGLLLLCPWPFGHIQHCCRLGFLGLGLTLIPLGWQTPEMPAEHIVHHLPPRAQPLTVEGTLDRPVESLGDRQRIYLYLHRMQRKNQPWQPVSGLVRLNVHATSVPFLPGDVLRVERLRLHRVRSRWNPGGFDFAGSMQRRGIYAVGGVSNPCRVQLRQRPERFTLSRMMARWRQRLRAEVRRHLSAPYDAVFLAMILGQRGDLPTALQDTFRITGAAHLLVVSGLHVGFITASVFWGWRQLLRTVRSRLPRAWLPGWRPTPWAAALSLPPMLVYCSLVGWHIPATRAALMAASALLALMLDRARDVRYALVLAAAALLLWEPMAWRDVGFQLSFVAVLAIVLVSARRADSKDDPPPEGRRKWTRRLQTYVLVSSAAYLGTAPIVAGTFRTLPTFGILANLALVPLASIIVPAGGAALAVSVLFPALAPLAFAIIEPLLVGTVALAGTIARLPGAQFHVAAPSPLMLMGYYGLLGSMLFRPRWRWSCAGLCTVLLIVGTGWQYLETRVRHLQVTFLDVGTGDAILVQAPGPYHLLIDGGGTYDGRFDIGARVIAPFLWDRHVRRFDLLALTHPHPNHARGLVSVLRLFSAQHLLTNGTPLTADYLRDLLAAGQRWGTQHHTALDGPRRWQWGRLQGTLLSPPSTIEQQTMPWAPPTENDRSLVLRLQYGNVRLLLTGDIQHATERWLLAHRADLRADILHIPHHGSKTSTLPAFVQRVRPQDGIISLGAGNSYGHPHPRVLEALTTHQVNVWRTDQHGAITITSDGTHYHITPFRPYQPPQHIMR